MKDSLQLGERHGQKDLTGSLVFLSVLFAVGNTYLCLAVLDSVLCVIFLHGRSSPHSSPMSTPRLLKSLSFELQPNDVIEKPMSPMQYARSGLGTAELNGKLIAAGKINTNNNNKLA